MPVNYQIIPVHNYPYVDSRINDNTEYTTVDPSSSGTTYLINVITSPRGIDGTLQTITGGLQEFKAKFGTGSGIVYGQPYMNAYNAASSGATILHVLRVTADDATYANIHVCVKYRVRTNDEGTPIMEVSYYALSTAQLTDVTMLDNIIDNLFADTEDPMDEWTHKHLFTIYSNGKGVYGNGMRIQVTNDNGSDKTNGYKNYYFSLLETSPTLRIKDRRSVIMNSEAIINEQSMYPEVIINDPDSGVEDITIIMSEDTLEELWETYLTVVPDTVLTRNTFDPLLGIDKTTNEEIENFSINVTEENSFALNALDGIGLVNGDDGVFATTADPDARTAAINAAYLRAFSGEYDPFIASKNKYPATFIFDANYDLETKKQIATLGVTRTDCVVHLDMGTNLLTKQSPLDYNNLLGDFVGARTHVVDAFFGKVKDPVSKKEVVVTCTYGYSAAYPLHIQENNGKHVPYAGINYAPLTGYSKNSITPVYDPDIDDIIMTRLTDAHINFARVSADGNGTLIRGSQDTRQSISSDLSEESMMLIALDIKRDVERYCESIAWKFSEASDLARFNKDIAQITDQYAYAQVREITAEFSKNEWEDQRNIVHLVVAYENRSFVKFVLAEIDVN